LVHDHSLVPAPAGNQSFVVCSSSTGARSTRIIVVHGVAFCLIRNAASARLGTSASNRQDWAACESVQRGLSSPHASSGPLAPDEDAVYAFVTTIARGYLGEAGPDR
jgi:Ring hydroxylating alpha subunit (catalytic domain)